MNKLIPNFDRNNLTSRQKLLAFMSVKELYDKTDEFVIKAVEKGEQFNKYTAVLNVEELEGTPFPYGFESNEQTIKACLEFAFEGTGWHVGTCTVKKKRTIEAQNLHLDCCECSISLVLFNVNIADHLK